MARFSQLVILPIRYILTAYGFVQFAAQVLWLGKWRMPKLIRAADHSDNKRKKALYAAHRHVVIYLKTLSLLKLVEFETIGEPVETKGIVIANHPCLLDFIVFLRDFPNAVCMYKPESLNNPVLSSFVQVAGYIKGMCGEQGESKRIIEDCGTRLQQGHHIVIFPEGSRSPGVANFHKFRTTAFHAAIKNDVPVLPVAIYCQPLFLGKDQPWYEFCKAKNKFTLYYLPPVYLKQLPEDQQSAAGLAKAAEQVIINAIHSLRSNPSHPPASLTGE